MKRATTRLQAYLTKTGEPPYKFASRLQLSKSAVYRLALGTWWKRGDRPNNEYRFGELLLRRVSEETGISPGVLVDDAIKAIEEKRIEREIKAARAAP